MKFITMGFMLWGGLLCGQTVIAPVVEGGANIPVPPCVTGQVYFNSGAAAGQNLYVCASNTWTQISGAASSGVSTNTSNTYAAGTVQSFLGTYEGLNPAELYRRLTQLRVQLEEASAGKSEGFGKRAYQGPDIRIGKRRYSPGGFRRR